MLFIGGLRWLFFWEGGVGNMKRVDDEAQGMQGCGGGS